LYLCLETRRYVRLKSEKRALFDALAITGNTLTKCNMSKLKESNGGKYEDMFVDGY